MPPFSQRLVIVLCLLWSSIAASWAATLYVAEHGSGGNPGTKLSPFGTINQASERAQSGDTVMVMPGVYRQPVTTKTPGVTFLSTEIWQAKLQIDTGGGLWTNWGHDVTIAGFEITGEGRWGILNYASGTRILGNHVHHIGMSCTRNVGAGIDHNGSESTNNDTIGNLVTHISWGCPIIPGWAGAHGIYHAYGSGLIANNIVLYVMSFGIHIWHEPQGTRIVHNVSCRNRHGIVVGGDPKRHQFADNIEVSNNIFCDNDFYGIREEGRRKNIHYGPNIVWGNKIPIEDLPGGATFEEILHVNPMFRGGDDYRLQSDSPARDRGSNAPGVTVDFAGWPRDDGHYDIGAYEYGGPQWPAAPPTSGLGTSSRVFGPLTAPTNFRLVPR